MRGFTSSRNNKVSVSCLLKICFWLGVMWWCVSFLWIARQASQEHKHDSPNYNPTTRSNHPEIDYVIPLDLVPNKPVRVSDRDRSKERIVTKDGRISFISTEAFREFGDEVRYLIRMGRDNLLNGGTNTTLAFRKRLHARAPWLKGDAKDPGWPYNTFPAQVNGKSIVICAGDPQLPELKNLVYSIRVDHNSDLPIRIIFLDDTDLTPPSRIIVESVIPSDKAKNIEFLNLSNFFNLKEVHLKGWDLKAYGLLAVPEYEVVFLDVDVMMLQAPDKMFQQQGYQEMGALFFHDRMLLRYFDFLYDPGTFATDLQPHLSPVAQKLIHNGDTPYFAEHIQESGMILIDKKRRVLGLWATCLIYGREDIRKYSQRYHMYGDKEMYWISFETIHEPYEFAKYYPGTIGGVATDFEFKNAITMPTDEDSQVESKLDDANSNHMGLCGRLVHFDDSGAPLWTNGGYLTKEEDWPSTNAVGVFPLNPVWFVDGGDWTRETFLPKVVLGPLEWFSWMSPQRPIAETFAQWERIKDNIPVNQYWKIQEQIGVNCLMANIRGIQQVPAEARYLASKSVERFFLVELGKAVKYAKYF